MQWLIGFRIQFGFIILLVYACVLSNFNLFDSQYLKLHKFSTEQKEIAQRHSQNTWVNEELLSKTKQNKTVLSVVQICKEELTQGFVGDHNFEETFFNRSRQSYTFYLVGMIRFTRQEDRSCYG